MHYRHDNTGSEVTAWARSAISSSSSSFCRVDTDGAPDYNNADLSWALAPGFAA